MANCSSSNEAELLQLTWREEKKKRRKKNKKEQGEKKGREKDIGLREGSKGKKKRKKIKEKKTNTYIL